MCVCGNKNIEYECFYSLQLNNDNVFIITIEK